MVNIPTPNVVVQERYWRLNFRIEVRVSTETYEERSLGTTNLFTLKNLKSLQINTAIN